MAEEEELSPEEKLLQVIQTGGKDAEGGDADTAATAAPADDSKPATKLKAVGKPPAKKKLKKKRPGGKLGAPKADGEEPALKKKKKKKTGASAKTLGRDMPVVEEPEPAGAAIAAAVAEPLAKAAEKPTFTVNMISRVLVLVFLLLVAGLTYEIFAGRPTFPPPPTEVMSFTQSDINFGLGDHGDLITTVTNNPVIGIPLDGRGPDPDPDPDPDPSPHPEPKQTGVEKHIAKFFRLDGVSVNRDNNSKSFALIGDAEAGETYIVRVGGTVPVLGTAVKLEQMNDKQVIFLHNGEEIFLKARRD